jgi:hypothetical protein
MGLGSEIRDSEETYPGSRGQNGTPDPQHCCFYFSGPFLPSWIQIRIANPDPGSPLNPDPDPQHCFLLCAVRRGQPGRDEEPVPEGLAAGGPGGQHGLHPPPRPRPGLQSLHRQQGGEARPQGGQQVEEQPR